MQLKNAESYDFGDHFQNIADYPDTRKQSVVVLKSEPKQNGMLDEPPIAKKKSEQRSEQSFKFLDVETSTITIP